MTQEKVIRILVGGRMAAKQASEAVKARGAEYIKNNVLNNEFVTRKEYEILHKLVIKLSEEVKSLKKFTSQDLIK